MVFFFSQHVQLTKGQRDFSLSTIIIIAQLNVYDGLDRVKIQQDSISFYISTETIVILFVCFLHYHHHP